MMVCHFRRIFLFLLVIGSNMSFSQEWEVRIDSFSSFSSPKAFDLNNDGVKDIVLGAGFEFEPEDGVFALDGRNGEQLWFTPSDYEIYGPAVPFYITSDEIPDFVMNGRFGALIAIDGANGSELWSLSDDPALPLNPATLEYYNVFTPCRIPDMDGDEIDDVMFTYGGGAGFRINDTIDHAFIGIASGSDGEILQFLPLPTASQTYMPPLLLESGEGLDVIAGTGGETHGGELFRFPLESLIAGNLDGIITIATNENKGYIQPPALADVNGDGHKDMMVANLDNQIFAYDGYDNRNIYTNFFPNIEFYGGPTPGYFNSDDILDFSVLGGLGEWPFYGGFRRYIIDITRGGGTLFDDIGGGLEVVNSAVSYQPEEMLRESHLLYTRNHIYNDSIKRMQVVEYDPFTDTETIIAELDSASAVGCVPLIEDLDDDGLMELVIVASDYSSGFGELDNRLIVKRINVDRPGVSDWSGYMGNLSNSHWQGETFVVSSNHEMKADAGLTAYPSPFGNWLNVKMPAEYKNNSLQEILIHSIDGKTWKPLTEEHDSHVLQIQVPTELPSGMFFISISSDGEYFRTALMPRIQ